MNTNSRSRKTTATSRTDNKGYHFYSMRAEECLMELQEDEIKGDERIPLSPEQVCEIADLMNLGLIQFDRKDKSFKGSFHGLLELQRILNRWSTESTAH